MGLKANLILWRHAEAEDGEDDLARPLTTRGHKQARKMAAWLHEQLPDKVRIVSSAALRARETAAAYSDHALIDPRLNPDCTVASYLSVAGWPLDAGTTLLVGHQPAIGRLAAYLLSGIEADWSARKGAIWWLQYRIRNDTPQTVLKAMLTPEQL
ncbi:histidine phosphatase family protein [Chitinimonas sp. BJYL2]|uniref:SixA phosphatase family protein n=1 Tax=Chitinimonas sp. BJYL2 TaxID=2976696 RepID=UPI0022B3B0C9|nr:histidine phosphatase family protein [Chitinimonas sp. BJYL2]